MSYFIKNKKLWAERSPWSNRVEFILFERVSANAVSHSTAINMYTPSENEVGNMIEPTFSLDMEEAQELMDNLWQLGLRPTEGTGSAGSLAATERHLEDMRKLVFDKDLYLIKNENVSN